MRIKFNWRTLKWQIKEIPIISFDSYRVARIYRNSLEGVKYGRQSKCISITLALSKMAYKKDF